MNKYLIVAFTNEQHKRLVGFYVGEGFVTTLKLEDAPRFNTWTEARKKAELLTSIDKMYKWFPFSYSFFDVG